MSDREHGDSDTEEHGVDVSDLGDSDRSFLAEIFRQISLNGEAAPAKPRECPLLQGKALRMESVAEVLRSGAVRRVVVLTGAGVSVAAGIPDFRTPGTGLYDNLQKYNLPFPEAIFEMDFFRSNPKPFFLLAKEMFPGSYRPTLAHFFIALLAKKQLLLRNFTQNIDTLERVAAVPPEFLVEAHGSFGGAHCISCGAPTPIDSLKATILDDQIPRCAVCKGYVKPDIVFFGESLPKRYFELSMSDLPRADLLLVLGTSLKVQPFASLIDHVDDKCPRVLINREAVGLAAGDSDEDIFHFGSRGGFVFEGANAYRDVFLEGDVQDSVRKLVEMCGWTNELQELMDAFDAKHGKSTSDNNVSASSSSSSTSTTTTTTTKKQESVVVSESSSASVSASGAKNGAKEKESEDDAEESKA